MEKHVKSLILLILGSIIAYAIIGTLEMSFEKIFLYIAVAIIDAGVVIGFVKRSIDGR